MPSSTAPVALFMRSASPAYVPEIDGLRAIAVMAVILFHVQVAALSGGFAGVDVFFVISGYLITGGLSRELAENGTLSLRRFYLRRARRLLPALYVTLFASAIAAVVLLSHHRLMAFGASLVSAALSISNIHFYLGSGYFDAASDYKPLLHTWSLGVEEQFYLLWPLLLLVARTGRWFRLLAVVLFLLALGFAEWLSHAAPAAAFFLAPFRIHEFVIGALLATSVTPCVRGGVKADAALVVGLALIAVAIFGFGARTAFPGLNALVPCLGAALVLWAGAASRWAWLLSNPVSVYLGRTSYSTYLVHWPLVVFLRVAKGREYFTVKEQVILLAVTLVLGHLVHRLVEQRLRQVPAWGNRRFLVGLLLSTATLLGAGWAMQQESWVQMRSWAASQVTPKEVELRRKARFQLRQQVCTVKGWDHCDDLVPGKRNALVIGDSHAVDAYNAFVTRFPQDNITLSDLGGCPPHPSIDQIVMAGHPDLPKCLELNRKRHDPSYLHRYDYIVINVYMDWYTEQHLAAYLQFLHDQGVRKVVVFGQTWRASDDLPELVNRVGLDRERLMALLKPAPSDGLVESTAAQLGYLFVSKTAALTSDGHFDVFDTREVLFTYDMHHLSLEHSMRLLEKSALVVFSYVGQ